MRGRTAPAIGRMRGLSRAVMAGRERAVSCARPRQARLRWASGVAAAACLLGLALACLNPHPDDEPTFSASDQPPAATDVAPTEEACADHPLLAACQGVTGGPSPNDPAGAGGSASAGPPSDAGSARSAGDAGFAEDARERDAGPVDASPGGSDAG
jgi:hypothetical protein